MHVLVTGGAGYIGSHACKALAGAGFVPVVYDNLSTGWADAVRFGPLVEGDLMDRAALDAAFARYKPVAVMHFAALSLVGESMTNPAKYWRTNVNGSLTSNSASCENTPSGNATLLTRTEYIPPSLSPTSAILNREPVAPGTSTPLRYH